jgi:hypothetical protein
MCVPPRLSSMALANVAKKIEFLTSIGLRFQLLVRQNAYSSRGSTLIYRLFELRQNRRFRRLEGKNSRQGSGKSRVKFVVRDCF